MAPSGGAAPPGLTPLSALKVPGQGPSAVATIPTPASPMNSVPGPASGGQGLGNLQLGGAAGVSVDISDLTGGGGGGGGYGGVGSGGLRPLGMLPIGQGGDGGRDGRGDAGATAIAAASQPISFVVLPVVLQGQGSSSKDDTVYDDQVCTLPSVSLPLCLPYPPASTANRIPPRTASP